MNEIPISMVMLAQENGADIECSSDALNISWTPFVGVLREVKTYSFRIANKTADGLRLDELLKKAHWCLDFIAYENYPVEEISSHLKDTEELIYWICRNPETLANYSLFKYPEPKTRPMTAYEMAMLPQGTAFVQGYARYYSPVVHDSEKENCVFLVVLDDFEPIYNFQGYILPNETELRKFEVEE